MKIFVDACPVVRIVEEVAEKYRISYILFVFFIYPCSNLLVLLQLKIVKRLVHLKKLSYEKWGGEKLIGKLHGMS